MLSKLFIFSRGMQRYINLFSFLGSPLSAGQKLFLCVQAFVRELSLHTEFVTQATTRPKVCFDVSHMLFLKHLLSWAMSRSSVLSFKTSISTWIFPYILAYSFSGGEGILHTESLQIG